ncbi:Transposable element P transposase [Paramuricea clavata]|uniref:Transposable element P transposase n=1 Tax=Paramuricea clavata TaxID=317549 RepID=A0A7D9JIB5_PARCT|nr:Transposable element P transposase [Paramuricea clavata]
MLITNEDEVLTDKFSNKRSTTKGSTSNPACANTGTATSVEAEECSDNTVHPFACPEEGCTKTYQRFSALQHHFDSEKHERALERETLLDKAILGYAIRLDEHAVYKSPDSAE